MVFWLDSWGGSALTGAFAVGAGLDLEKSLGSKMDFDSTLDEGSTKTVGEGSILGEDSTELLAAEVDAVEGDSFFFWKASHRRWSLLRWLGVFRCKKLPNIFGLRSEKVLGKEEFPELEK